MSSCTFKKTKERTRSTKRQEAKTERQGEIQDKRKVNNREI